MDNDDCEELIIRVGTCEADMVIWFCKYLNGAIEKIGCVSGGHSGLCGNSNEDGVTIHYGHQGVEWIDSVKIENNTLKVTEVISQREVDEYSEFEYCIPLTYYSIDDMSPLIEFGGIDNSKEDAKEDTSYLERDNRVGKSMVRSQVEALWGQPFQEVVEHTNFGYIKTCYYYDACNDIRIVSYYSDGTIYGLFPDYERY